MPIASPIKCFPHLTIFKWFREQKTPLECETWIWTVKEKIGVVFTKERHIYICMCIAPDFSSKQVQRQTNPNQNFTFVNSPPYFPSGKLWNVSAWCYSLMVWTQKVVFLQLNGFEVSDIPSTSVLRSTGFIDQIWNHPFFPSLKVSREFLHSWQCVQPCTHTYW